VPLLDRIDADLKAAMKAGDALRVSTLRLARSAMKYKEIQAGRALTEEDVVDVLSVEAKRRRESVAEYEKAGREDLRKKEADELVILAAYLPAQMDEAEVKALVSEAVRQSGAASPKDMGKVMGVLMPKVKGRADGKLVNRLVREALGG
jgi:uncharacterized protein YqeY